MAGKNCVKGSWYTNGTTDLHDGRTGGIHHDGDVHVGVGTASSAIILSNANAVATVPDIKMFAQGLIQSESNQFYQSQTGSHQFIGGNTGGVTGSFPLVDFNQNGEVEFNQYGAGNFTGTPAFNLSVDASGNVIETDIISNTVEVDQTFDATFQVTNTDIHNSTPIVAMTDKVLDAGWSRAANVVTYTGTPEKVEGYISISAPDSGASNYWARPKLRVLRGGNVIAIIDDLVMQQNGAYDGDAVINGVFFDKQPGVNPAYTFEWFDQENRTATLPARAESQIALVATEKVTVFTP